MKIGSHVSMSAPDYLLGSAKQAINNDANCLMIYSGAPQNTKRSPIEKLKVKEFHELLKEYNINLKDVIVHAPYIINLANTVDASKSEFACEFLRQEIKRVEAIGATYLVVHPGSHVKAGEQVGLDKIVEGLDQAMSDNQSVDICLETMAGKGSELGTNFEQLAYIIEHANYPNHLKVCLDTCHLNDAGYDVSNFDHILDEFDQIIGLDKLAVIHLNDSKNERAAHKDRHANLGQGTIGFEALYEIAINSRVTDIPKILETPFIDGKEPYKDEIAMLKNHKFKDIVKKED